MSTGDTTSEYWMDKYGIQMTMTDQCPAEEFYREPGSKSNAYNEAHVNCRESGDWAAEAIGCAHYPRAKCSDDCIFSGCASGEGASFYDLTAFDLDHNEVAMSDYAGKVVLVVNVASY